MKPETVVKAIKPLAEWMSKHKPNVRVLTISADQRKVIIEAKNMADNGFHKISDTLHWREFELRTKPLDTSKPKQESA